MTKHRNLFSLLTILSILLIGSTASAQTSKTTAQKIKEAAQKAGGQQKFDLSYKLQKDQEFRWTVEHTATTSTHMPGLTEETSSRVQSTKVWKVSNIDSLGNMSFVYSIESVNGWEKVGDNDPITYDSKSGQEPPKEYAAVAEKIGRPLAVIAINSKGQVVDRKSEIRQASFGAGEITLPLPKEPIAVGHEWFVPKQLNAKDKNGVQKQLKARIRYELARVKMPNAYISFKTEVLTPIESEKIRSQLIQQLTKGYVVFDIKRGLLVHKEVQWNEKVHGFEGDESLLSVDGKMVEKLLTDSVSQNQTGGSNANNTAEVKIKGKDGKPIMRK